MQNPFLIGEKIYLRPLEPEDSKIFLPWVNDPEVINTMQMYTPKNLPIEQEFIAGLYKSDRDIVLGIVIKANDKLIGSTGLHRIDWKNRHALFGILIGDKTEWDKGYGTEATKLMLKYGFEALNLNRIQLLVHEFNQRGIKAYERAGFKKEGVLRQAHFHQGRYYDTIVMGILREEWEGLCR